MSTHASVTFKDEMYTSESYTLWWHYDGYPEGVAAKLSGFFVEFEKHTGSIAKGIGDVVAYIIRKDVNVYLHHEAGDYNYTVTLRDDGNFYMDFEPYDTTYTETYHGLLEGFITRASRTGLDRIYVEIDT